jgi:hypothetical protein
MDEGEAAAAPGEEQDAMGDEAVAEGGDSETDDTAMKPGVIGLIELSRRFDADDVKLLKAAAQAQAQTAGGVVPLFVRPPDASDTAQVCSVLDIILKEHSSASAAEDKPPRPAAEVMSKVVVVVDGTAAVRGLVEKVISTRHCFVAFSGIGQFSVEENLSVYRSSQDLHASGATPAAPPQTDRVLADELSRVLAPGGGGGGAATSAVSNRILLSNGLRFRTSLVKYGGKGYRHIMATFASMLRERGVPDGTLKQVMVTNPNELLHWWVAPPPPPVPVILEPCDGPGCEQVFEAIEGHFFEKFAFRYCSPKCLAAHRESGFAPPPPTLHRMERLSKAPAKTVPTVTTAVPAAPGVAAVPTASTAVAPSGPAPRGAPAAEDVDRAAAIKFHFARLVKEGRPPNVAAVEAMQIVQARLTAGEDMR